MSDILEEFEFRRSFLKGLGPEDITPRLVGFLKWLQSNSETDSILQSLRQSVDGSKLVEVLSSGDPPSSPEEIAAFGLILMDECQQRGEDLEEASRYFEVGKLYDDRGRVALSQYIIPAIDYIHRQLKTSSRLSVSRLLLDEQSATGRNYPLEITKSLEMFLRDHPDIKRNAFVMMRFGTTKAHDAIITAIRSTLEQYEIEALRADDKEYHDDLFPNVLTYIYGSSFGIAVFERLEEEDFNPNVSLEVGYMRALGKRICLMKDKTLKDLQTDLVGKLYRPFDPQDPAGTIQSVLEAWLRDKEIITA